MPPKHFSHDTPSGSQDSDGVEEDVKCTVCKDGGREDMMLLCDLCDGGWHR